MSNPPELHPHPLWDELRQLELPARDYVVFGSGPLLAHRLVDEIHDLDLVARGRLAREPFGRALEGRLEIFGGWSVTAVDANALIDEAELIGSLPFARLAAVLAFKRALSRPKDLGTSACSRLPGKASSTKFAEQAEAAAAPAPIVNRDGYL